jgi:DNA repair exonuclease SbcCD nuclease subunit
MKIAFTGDAHLTEATPRARKDVYYKTVLKKLEFVIDQNDVTILLGDLFHRPATANLIMSELVGILTEAKKKGKRIFSILGNHCVSNGNIDEEFFVRTSIHLLFKIGLLEELKSEAFGPLVIEAIPFMRRVDEASFKAMNSPTILVGHYFFESMLDPHFSIHTHQIDRSGYTSLILGHDHRPLQPIDAGGTMVIIPGSIGRNTSHQYNLERIVRYCRVTLDEGNGTVRHSFEEIPTRPASEVFHDGAMMKPSESAYAFLANMESLLDGFKRLSNADGRITIRKALESIETPKYVIDYLREVHKRLQIDF